MLIQHVTVHLADSLPQSAVERIELSLKGLPEGWRLVERRKRLHEWVDAGHGSCILCNPGAAEIVQNAFLYFHEIRYYLHAWVVMPNHFHVLFEPIDNWTLARIVTSWKRFTARKIREYLRGVNSGWKSTGLPRDEGSGDGSQVDAAISAGLKTGDPGSGERPFWHREYWDRYICNEEHYYDTIEYIHNNPVKARLVGEPEEWPWSSAEWGFTDSVD